MRKNVVRMSRPSFDELAAAEVFLQVVRTKNFTAAARALGKSTSSLSRSVAQLERHLGAPLLVRTTRRLRLTEAGALYLGHADRLLAARRAAHDAVAELSGGVPRGNLRVTMPVVVGERLLGAHLPALRRACPELRLEIDLSDRNQPLVQGGFDLAIRLGRQVDSSMRAQLLGRVPLRMVASPGYLAHHGHPERPLALRQHHCVTVAQSAGPVEWAFYHRHTRTRSERLEVDGVVQTTSPQLAAQLAVRGMGILRVVEWVVRDELRRGELVEVLPTWACQPVADGGGLAVYVVFPQGVTVEPPLKARRFVELVKRVLAEEVLADPATATATATATRPGTARRAVRAAAVSSRPGRAGTAARRSRGR